MYMYMYIMYILCKYTSISVSVWVALSNFEYDAPSYDNTCIVIAYVHVHLYSNCAVLKRQ